MAARICLKGSRAGGGATGVTTVVIGLTACTGVAGCAFIPLLLMCDGTLLVLWLLPNWFNLACS